MSGYAPAKRTGQPTKPGPDGVGPAAEGARPRTDALRGMSYEAGVAALAPAGDSQTAGEARPETEAVDGTLWATNEKGEALPPSLVDVKQGSVGDCFLFAAMAAIVNTDPSRISGLIDDNGDGTYTVRFEGLGLLFASKQTVTADFQVGKRGRVGARKATWPLVIEKAYAAQIGGMDKLDKGGNPGTAVDTLIDENPHRFTPADVTAAAMMKSLAKAKTKKWPTTLLAPAADKATSEAKKLADKVGVVFHHAYAVIDVDEKGQRIKLFNPWGQDHPNGDGWLDIADAQALFVEADVSH